VDSFRTFRKKEKCFMTLNAQEKADLARYRAGKAEALLSDAKTLIAAGSWASSANRSYYAVLSAARSLLALRGQEPESHEGVKTVLSRDFIKTGVLPPISAETMRVLQARRMDSDYADYVEITEAEALDSLARAREFVTMAAATLQAMLKGA
jgi:uncharacterized protein (UPF0332 family)